MARTGQARDAKAGFSEARRRRAPALARVFAGALALLLLAAVQSQSFALFGCAFTGATLTRCCCPATDQAIGVDVDSIARGCCCHVEQIEASLPTGASASQTLLQPPVVLIALAYSLPPAPLALSAASPARKAAERGHPEQPRAGPPLTIVHRRLLI